MGLGLGQNAQNGSVVELSREFFFFKFKVRH